MCVTSDCWLLGRGALVARCSASGESLVGRSLDPGSVKHIFIFSLIEGLRRLYASKCIVRDVGQSRCSTFFRVWVFTVSYESRVPDDPILYSTGASASRAAAESG
jgi:hypothetical protein